MAGGVRGRANPDYSQTEYSQPWGGIDVSKPSSQIDPGSAVTLTGAIIRGGLTNPAQIYTPISSIGVTWPTYSPGENPVLIDNLSGNTIIVTQIAIYTDFFITVGATKAFQKIFTFPTTYTAGRFGSVVIGSSMYISSAEHLGVYKITGAVVSEITAQNGSGPFIGGDFLGTIAQRLVLGNIIGGDGNQTGSVTGIIINNGGTGYPASGQITFTGGGGQNASATFSAVGGVITGFSNLVGGTGYLSPPLVSIISTTGTGFVGTAAISAAATPSTNTFFPDYFAWSFPNAYGSFDPNSISLGGGFDQLTEARGLITGLAVFEAVCFVAHNGGFTEATPNTAGSNIEPFTFNPLWSADQGVVCRYGSMAQYGAEVRFLALDQPYQLSPAGLTPFGDKISSLVQNLSYWNDNKLPIGVNGGIFGSIVEIEGEKHYFLVFTSNDPTFTTPSNRFTYLYDCHMKTDAWAVTFYPGLTMSAPPYQSYDTQDFPAQNKVIRDNWILAGFQPPGFGTTGGFIGNLTLGKDLVTTYQAAAPLATASMQSLFRAETPTMAIPQTTRRLVIEYENIPTETSALIGFTFFGQPLPNSAGNQAPISISSTFVLPYFPLSATVPPNAVLTIKIEPQGTAQTVLSTQLQVSTIQPVRLIRVMFLAETTQSDLQ